MCVISLFSDPTYPFAVFPDSFPHLPGSSSERAFPMLTPSLPASLVFSPVWPVECPEPRLLVIQILSVVLTPIWPRVNTLPMHQIVLPVALILSSVSPLVRAKALHCVVKPFSTVFVLICPRISTDTLSLTFYIIAYVT